MLAAVALLTAVLVTSCDNPIEKIVQGQEEDNFIPFDPPAGMGYIRIKIADNARTIMPTLPVAADMDYHIIIQDQLDSNTVVYDSASDPDNSNASDPISYDDLTGNAFVLPPSTYRVIVTAYNPGTTDMIGSDTVANVVLSPGVGGTATIKLVPEKTGGSGTFIYDISLPSNINATTTASLTVTTYPSNTSTSITSANLRTTNNNGAGTPLAAGFYNVRIVMTDSSGTLQDRTITNILHVYVNLDSKYTPALANLNPYKHEVTYDENGGDTLPTTVYGPFNHGSTLIENTDSPAVLDLTNTTDGLPFGFWSTSSSATLTSKWTFGSSGTKLIGDVTLYAIWSSDVPLTFSINWITPTLPTLDDANYIFNQSKFYNGIAQSVTLDITTLGDYHIVRWEDEKGTNLGALPITLSNGYADIDIFTTGTHVFTCIIDNATNNDPHSLPFTLTIDP